MMCNQMPAGQRKEENKKLPVLQQSKEKPKAVKNPKVQVKEETHESNVEVGTLHVFL